MKTISATFKIVTPMFLGDAEQKATSIRPPSIKGALRFWWRALNWKNAIEQNNGNEDAAVSWLHREEARLFGTAANDNTDTPSGQGVFLLKVKQKRLTTYRIGESIERKTTGIEYLMGQGLWHFRNKLTRDAIKEGQEFSVSLAFKPYIEPTDIDMIVKAFCLFGLLGGLGSRARHGFGSVAIQNVTSNEISLPCDFKLSQTQEGYISLIKQIVGTLSDVPLPPISAFSSLSKVNIVCEGDSPQSILSCVGKEMQLYRSYGRHGRVGGQAAEQNFQDDHDNVKNMTLQTPPRRTVFGLPHNYFFSSDGTNIEINAIHDKTEARRASPLLLHIHPIGRSHVAVHTLLQSLFLPQEAKVVVKNKQSRETVKLSPTVEYGVIETYLDRFQDAKRIIG